MKKRNATIDLMKFVFALIIVLFHASANLKLGFRFFVNGRLAVEFFFIVSGYLMVRSAMKESAAQDDVFGTANRQILHKIKGLFPDYLIAWAISFAITSTGMRDSAVDVIKRFLSGVFEFLFMTSAGFDESARVNNVTWFLSAMILAMALLLPVFLKNRRFYLKWLAPVGSVFLYGFLVKTWKYPFTSSIAWNGFVTKGTLRAVAGMLLGAVAYSLSEQLKKVRFSTFSRVLLTAVEAGGYLFFIYYVYGHDHSSFDIALVFWAAVSVMLSFSGCTYSGDILSGLHLDGACTWLGIFSLDLYLSHAAWVKHWLLLFPSLSGMKSLVLFLAASFGTALAVYILSAVFRKNGSAISGKMKKIFLAEDL